MWLFVAGGVAGLTFRSLPSVVVGMSMLAPSVGAAVARIAAALTSL